MARKKQETVNRYVKATELDLILTAIANENKVDLPYIVKNLFNAIIDVHGVDVVRNILKELTV